MKNTKITKNGNDYVTIAAEAAAWFETIDSFQRACFSEWAYSRYGVDVLDMNEADFVEAYEEWLKPPFDI